MSKTLIIAEAGVNHNGSLETALALVDAAAAAGADVVKFQTFQAQHLVTATAPKAAYQEQDGQGEKSQYQMLGKLELSREMHLVLGKRCKEQGVAFNSTAFDTESMDMLVSMGMDFIKIPSGEITNYPYLCHAAQQGLPILLSTGMSNMEDIRQALAVLEDNGMDRQQITLLHCHTDYPTRMEDVNLRAMTSMYSAFGMPVGYSDHTLGLEVPIAAVALGAVVIEKHFTLGRDMPGPDHAASLEPEELRQMVQAIRNIEMALGDGVKQPTAREQAMQAVARRSIVAACPIRAGEPFTEYNLAAKRPGTGISPMYWKELMGKPAKRDYDADEIIEP
ncbi:N-acetylneuraminate synthase [Thiolapillus brandeum]|uniref:N-acetylneuraminate synthase n=1 Tax=Thiolapillus brandeum TaxID=1076588 RepID=A0A7U6GHH3_9GAMM|nr:N-acetylneuraminate synthase [Thiolapillus brandeum]BAO43678.1 N-acetylneuraminate synthase [Thiolapillus brandeum]